MSQTSLRYDCLACRKEVYPSIPVVPPAQWDWRQRQAPRVLCPDCGCACAPYAWRLVAFEVCHQHAAQGMHIDMLAHEKWAGCPNSYDCSTVNTYAGDCEQDQSMRPKCLVALHSRLLHIERQLDAQATRERGRPRKRQAPAAPTSAPPGM